jgi:hypothetical protein
MYLGKLNTIETYQKGMKVLNIYQLFALYQIDINSALLMWREYNTSRMTLKHVNLVASRLERKGKGQGYAFKRYIVHLVRTFGYNNIIQDRVHLCDRYVTQKGKAFDSPKNHTTYDSLAPRQGKRDVTYRQLDRQLTYIGIDITYSIPQTTHFIPKNYLFE